MWRRAARGDLGVMRPPARFAAITLLGISGLHVAWGRGSSFPFSTNAELTDAVVGNDIVPPPMACYSVAAMLAMAAAAIAGLPSRSSRLRRLAVMGTIAALSTRAAFGFAGRTDVLVPGSASPKFRRLDRHVYSPLCAALAVGAAASLRS